MRSWFKYCTAALFVALVVTLVLCDIPGVPTGKKPPGVRIDKYEQQIAGQTCFGFVEPAFAPRFLQKDSMGSCCWMHRETCCFFINLRVSCLKIYL